MSKAAYKRCYYEKSSLKKINITAHPLHALLFMQLGLKGQVWLYFGMVAPCYELFV